MITAINEKVVAFSKLSENNCYHRISGGVGPLLLAIGAILSIIPAIVAGFALGGGHSFVGSLTLLYGAYVILNRLLIKRQRSPN
jgi:hypothetical protein